MVRPERAELLLSLFRGPTHGRVDPRRGVSDEFVQIVASLVDFTVALKLAEEFVDLVVLSGRRVGLLLEL